MANRSNYDKFPFVTVDPSPSACSVGWEAITAQLRKFCDKQRNGLLYVSNVIRAALSMKSSPSRTHNRDQDSLSK